MSAPKTHVIEHAKTLARIVHYGQTRKVNGRASLEHPMQVAKILSGNECEQPLGAIARWSTEPLRPPRAPRTRKEM